MLGPPSSPLSDAASVIDQKGLETNDSPPALGDTPLLRYRAVSKAQEEEGAHQAQARNSSCPTPGFRRLQHLQAADDAIVKRRFARMGRLVRDLDAGFSRATQLR